MKKNIIIFFGAFFLLMTFSSRSNALTFTMPYDADLFFSPVGGSAGAITEFGIGSSVANHTPYFTNLPNNPTPNFEVEVGMFLAGTDLEFYQKTVLFGNTYWAFSDDTDQGSLCAFTDIDNSLGFGGSVIEQTSINTWLLHLDDAASLYYDDDDNDILMQIRLSASTPAPVPEPATILMFGIGLIGFACTSISRRKK